MNRLSPMRHLLVSYQKTQRLEISAFFRVAMDGFGSMEDKASLEMRMCIRFAGQMNRLPPQDRRGTPDCFRGEVARPGTSGAGQDACGIALHILRNPCAKQFL